jgi:thioredoxin 1
MSKQFNDANFQAEAIEASKSKPVLVDFYAEWCGPCKMQGPIVDEVANEIGDKAVVGKLNTDEAMQVAQSYNIMSIPTLMVFKNGQPVEKFIGMQSKDSLMSALKKHI